MRVLPGVSDWANPPNLILAPPRTGLNPLAGSGCHLLPSWGMDGGMRRKLTDPTGLDCASIRPIFVHEFRY